MWFAILKYFCFFCFMCKFIAMITMGRCKSKKRMDGKIVLITGGNGGIGKEITRDLAMRGARIIMGCRNIKSAIEIKDEIEKETGNSKISVVKLDLSCLDSVREFSNEILKTEQCIDVLIHCAGILPNGIDPEKQITKTGIDIAFATNHLSVFLMTNLLIDLMKKSESGRIIVVTSLAHLFSFKKFDKINYKELAKENGFVRYAASKYANMLFTQELARRLKNSGITVNCLHPGIIYTNMMHSVQFGFYTLLRQFEWTYKTTEEGAQTSIYLAVSDEVAKYTGKYFIDCYPFNISANETENAKHLWKVSEELVDLKQHEKLIKDV